MAFRIIRAGLFVLIGAFTSNALALQIFFSASGTDSRVATVFPGPTNNQLYIWAVPSSADKTVSNICLNLRVTNPASGFHATGFSIYNPGGTRWQSTNNGTINPSNRAQGANGVPQGYIALYKTITLGGMPLFFNGTGISAGPGDDGTGAYLYGTLSYDITAAGLDLGSIFFQVGGADTGGPGQADPSGGLIFSYDPATDKIFNPTVFFGAGDASVNSDDRGAESSIADAQFHFDAITLSIPPVPESTALLSFALIAPLSIERQRFYKRIP